MPFLKQTRADQVEAAGPAVGEKASSSSTPAGTSTPGDATPPTAPAVQAPAEQPQGKVTFIACFLGLVASIGGFMFGYTSGQISGFFDMPDYGQRFGQPSTSASGEVTYSFSAARQGTITGLLPVGCLFGALVAGKLADVAGRRLAISLSALWACVGIVIEITSSAGASAGSDYAWVQFAMGRFTTGISIGALSVAVPMYQSESSPALIRGLLVSTYQLFVTLGIWTSYMVEWGTDNEYTNSASWRIPNGLGFLWSLILGVGIMFLPESPRHAFRCGREDEARATIARLAGVSQDSREVRDQIAQIRAKLNEEEASGKASWIEIFTGPRMLSRTLLGVTLQAGQQLTGANFFFYFGTTVFRSTGLSDSYVTQIILGTVNVICTFGGMYVAQKVGRRPALIAGAAWIMGCFFIYAFVGHYALDSVNPLNTPQAGSVLVVFSCLAIGAFAATWGPLVWAVVAELYPARYRAPCMALATASNWFFNFLISFFTRFITDAIDYFYGFVFAGCCGALIVIVYFFVIETKDRSLEEIDTMYLLRVNPIKSAHWDGSKPHEHSAAGASAENNAAVVEEEPVTEQV